MYYTHFKRILQIEEKPVIKVIPRAARFPIIETCIRRWWRIKGMGKNRVYKQRVKRARVIFHARCVSTGVHVIGAYARIH